MNAFLLVIRRGSSATGFAVTNFTAYLPTGTMLLRVRNDICDAPSEPVFGSITRRNEYTTSAEVNGLPVQNFTSLRSWNVQTVPLALLFHEVASEGSTLKLLSSVVSRLYAALSLREFCSVGCLAGSSEFALPYELALANL